MAKNPKKVVNAFFPPALSIKTLAGEKLVLREFSIASLLFLQRLGHPLVSRDDPAARVAQSQDDTVRLLFVLTRPVADCKALLDEGDDAFDSAVLNFAETLPVAQLATIRSAVLETFSRAWATALATVPAGEKKTK